MIDDAGWQRLFVAVPVDPAVTARVAELVASLPVPDGRAVRWVRLDGLHLTLRFLGPTAPDRVPRLIEAVDLAASASPPFEVAIAGAGAFPARGRPRALWLGVERGSKDLAALAQTLDARLVAEGWPPVDRPFRPHLTLARSDGVPSGAATAAALIEAAQSFRETFQPDRLIVFESQTGGGPARYVPVHEAGLGA